MFVNPYAVDLGDRAPLEALGDAADAIRETCGSFAGPQWDATYAPGKWTAAQILLHLAQMELVFAVRARFALSADDYVAQSLDQDPWLDVERSFVDGPAALRAFLALRAMNVGLFRGITEAQRSRTLRHPEWGTITVADLIAYLAGHDWRHVGQLRKIEHANR